MDDGGADVMDTFVAKIQIFYSADDIKKEDPTEALKLYRQCVAAYDEWKAKTESGDVDEELDDDTITLALKALVAQISILLNKGEEQEALKVYDRVFTFAKNPSVSESDFRKEVMSVLNAAVELKTEKKSSATEVS